MIVAVIELIRIKPWTVVLLVYWGRDMQRVLTTWKDSFYSINDIK